MSNSIHIAAELATLAMMAVGFPLGIRRELRPLRFTVNHDGIEPEPGTDNLIVPVECEELGKSYVVTWSLANVDLSERMAVVEPKELCPNEAWELARWLDCDDDLQDRVEREIALFDPR